MSSFDEQQKEVRAQRHDFIKEYYKMAAMDLDRHLKGGWQTIVVLAGGAAILTAGHDGKIGLPISTAMALVAALWGALTVIDANYWSLRAIGFLANVEAVYLSARDRTHFNPYVGIHPPYKLMDSLRYLFCLCAVFGLAAFVDMLWEISARYPTSALIIAKLRTIGALRLAIWGIPVMIAIWGALYVLYTYRKRLENYIEFSHQSPGPGVQLEPGEWRHVTLAPLVGAAAPILEPDTQGNTHSQLDSRLARYNCLVPPAFALVLLITALYVGAVLAKSAGI
jgi:hypothetical protein